MSRIDSAVAQRFAVATGVLMTRHFGPDADRNPRGMMFALGPVIGGGSLPESSGAIDRDVLGLGFQPGRERRGPRDAFVVELRDGRILNWRGCRLWAESESTGLVLLSRDPAVRFGFDGHSLVRLETGPRATEEGLRLARRMLREAASRVPLDLETRTMQ